jgi:hypothetical protein
LSKYISELHKQGTKEFILPMPLIVDEGIAKAGTSIDLPNWGSVINEQKAFFTTSKESPGIQVADFAAFVISRTQWIMAKQKKDVLIKRGDLEFLKMTNNLNIVNIPMLPFWLKNISKEIYEDGLSEDRSLKELPSINSKKI